MQSPCALYVPHYTVQALRARGKRAVSRLTSRFRLPAIVALRIYSEWNYSATSPGRAIFLGIETDGQLKLASV